MSGIKQQINNINLLKKNILDPLSTIIKLAVLGKKEIGCKVLLKNNQIFIQESGMFQGIARYYHGVTKNDIHYLSIPIDLACKRYLTIEKIHAIPDIIIIFKCAQDGLNNLMETYVTYPIIVHCLKYYYTIIDTYLHLISCKKIEFDEKSKNENDNIYKKINNETTKPLKIPKNKNKETNIDNSESYHTPILNIEYLNQSINDDKNEMKDISINNDENNETSETNVNDLLVLYTDELLNKFDSIWDKPKIKIVIDMIKYLLEEKSASEYAAYIETFMIPIDKEIIKFI
jgi:hypothetical protein